MNQGEKQQIRWLSLTQSHLLHVFLAFFAESALHFFTRTQVLHFDLVVLFTHVSRPFWFWVGS